MKRFYTLLATASSLFILTACGSDHKDSQAVSHSSSSKSVAKKVSKKSVNYDKKAETIFENDLGGTDEYPLIGHIEVNHSGDDITGVSVWGDESLTTASPSDLKHYFSAGAQIGSRLLNKDYKVPFIQVYAGNKKVARSEYGNNSQMKDLR
ncbi:hypothetical protein [Pediococcus stilesii]|uniref:Uncharacterized protein n=1 Tax=Pediococcus stilesii TaxID=331679 RepID=A0A0R2L9I5_9LACO|nr:hypothetical protein [Pediococcus stilesii]KRN95124.1 hypothetical protein IV81_GL000006 [Pediococcus stilesii]